MMREINRETGVAFLMVTHDERLAQAADRILTIEDRYVHESDTAPPVGKNAGHDSTDL